MSHEKSKKKPAALVGSGDRYINRELSWLGFNTRVVEEASNPHTPLLERLMFLSISAANLDEFYMVRVAGLLDQIRHGITTPSADGLTPEEQLKKIHVVAEALMQKHQESWLQIRNELAEEDIAVIGAGELTSDERKKVESYFMENIFPVLTPIAIDPAHPFPFLPNLGLALVFQLTRPKSEQTQIAVLPLPSKLSRFVKVSEKGRQVRYVLVEDVIELFLDTLFPGYEKQDSAIFNIVRDSDLDIEEDAEDLMRYFERAVKRRRRGRVIRVKTLQGISDFLLQFIADHLQVEPESILQVKGLLGVSNINELYDQGRPDLKHVPFKARFPERINDFGGDYFASIQAKDIVVHHPFETFDVVVQFLRQAAEDPDVVSIKQTLYRTSKDSPIVQALIAAADAGKSVTALVELKARFDEEANIKWARDLERAGVQVVYGFVKLKTHAKLSLVVRREEGKLRTYAHFGTGNYHPNTARVYTDLSYFTCDPVLCLDASYLFNFVTGYAPPKAFKKLVMAPRSMRDKVLELIDQEIAHVEAGRPGTIWAKMNALVDPRVIEALYKASQKGVTIELVVRGVCCLRPGVKGMSENIHVKSIVGRFLEHSRIFCFGNGHGLPSPNAKLYISSADWMSRNFDWRVEVMVPIENPTVHAQILSQVMLANLKDEKNSWVLMPDGNYRRVPFGEESFSAHEYFMNNPSLSGRGKALRKTKSASKDLYKLYKKRK